MGGAQLDQLTSRPSGLAIAWDNLSPPWFAAGMLLSAATALRVADLAGPGEILLGGWLLTALAMAWQRGELPDHPLARKVLWFWCASFGLLVAGWLVAGYLQIQGWQVERTALAYMFTASVTIAFVLQPGLESTVRKTLPYVLAFSIVPLTALFVFQVGTNAWGGSPLWGGSRWYGWAQNPNQLALVVGPLPFLGAFLLRNGLLSPNRQRLYLAFTVTAIVLGFASQSDALLVGWAIAGLVILHGRLSRKVRQWGPAARRAAPVAFALAGLALVLLTAQSPGLADRVNQNDQIQVRLALWWNGLEALAVSPLVGLGPGAFSGLDGPFSGGEAHNTIIDWAVSTGLLGAALFVGLLAHVTLSAWRTGRLELRGAVVSLWSISLFHFVLRQPTFWFFLIAVGALALSSTAAVHARASDAGAPPMATDSPPTDAESIPR